MWRLWIFVVYRKFIDLTDKCNKRQFLLGFLFPRFIFSRDFFKWTRDSEYCPQFGELLCSPCPWCATLPKSQIQKVLCERKDRTRLRALDFSTAATSLPVFPPFGLRSLWNLDKIRTKTFHPSNLCTPTVFKRPPLRVVSKFLSLRYGLTLHSLQSSC